MSVLYPSCPRARNVSPDPTPSLEEPCLCSSSRPATNLAAWSLRGQQQAAIVDASYPQSILDSREQGYRVVFAAPARRPHRSNL